MSLRQIGPVSSEASAAGIVMSLSRRASRCRTGGLVPPGREPTPPVRQGDAAAHAAGEGSACMTRPPRPVLTCPWPGAARTWEAWVRPALGGEPAGRTC
jgi:hypothetical protein